jgi:mycothiol synthase
VDPAFHDRPVAPADLDAVVGLLRAGELADHGRVTADWAQIVRFMWRDPGFTLAEDGRAVEAEGSFVGFVGVFREDDEGHEPFGAMAVADPAHRDGSDPVVGFLVEWSIARARERGAHALRHYIQRDDAERRAMLHARGFERVRSMFTMHRELAADAGVSPAPDGIAIVTLAEHPDVVALHAADQEAFGEHFGFAPETFEAYRARRIDVDDHDPTQWFLALDADEVVGFLYQVTGGDVPQVAQLGVRKPWRGRGIGSALLRRSFADIARRGGREVTLWVDSENATGAIGVYERVGMRPIVITDLYEVDLDVPDVDVDATAPG